MLRARLPTAICALAALVSGCLAVHAHIAQLGSIRERKLFEVTCPFGPDCEIEMARVKLCPTGVYAWYDCDVAADAAPDARKVELVLCNLASEHDSGSPTQRLARCNAQGVIDALGE